MIDDRTPNLDLPLPHADNTLTVDVARLRTALTGADSALGSVQTTVSGQISALQTTVNGQISALETTVDGQLAAMPTRGLIYFLSQS